MEAQKQIVLSSSQLRLALSLTDLQPDRGSPLDTFLDTSAAPSSDDVDVEALRQAKWIYGEQSPTISDEALKALEAISRPRLTISLLVGTPSAIGFSRNYSARGWDAGSLVSWMEDPESDSVELAYPRDPGGLIDILTGQVLPGPVGDTMIFQAMLPQRELVTLLSILDWKMDSVYRAKLNREPNPIVRFTPNDLWKMLVEGRMASDLSWLVTAFTYLMPDMDFDLSEADLGEALNRLSDAGLANLEPDGRHSVTDRVEELSESLLPLLSFGALQLEQQSDQGEWRRTHVVVLRGLQAILLFQPVMEAGQEVVSIDAVSGDELGMLLLSIAQGEHLEAGKEQSGSERQLCPGCSTEYETGIKYCTRCGEQLPERPGRGEERL
jgi:hypothetical protein